MKLSLKVQDQQRNPPHNHHHQNPVLLRAKIPITVFGLPFLSGFAAADNPSDLSLSLRTNFASGPSLKLSYAPTSITAATSSTPPLTLTLTLKSGVGLFGSPYNSPLIISANFSFSPQNPNPNPTFSLEFKPRVGDFSLRKTTFSDPSPNAKANGTVNSIGFVPIERPVVWKDLTVGYHDKHSIFSGIAVMAKTALPVTKRVAVNFRWGVNFPADFGKQMPFLSVNKIGLERVDKVKDAKKKSEGTECDLEVLKGMYSWMRRELDVLQRENREMKHTLEEMKMGGQPVRNHHSHNDSVGKKPLPAVENSRGFEQWRSKKSGGEDNGQKESKKNVNRANDVESELQRAIKAASS